MKHSQDKGGKRGRMEAAAKRSEEKVHLRGKQRLKLPRSSKQVGIYTTTLGGRAVDAHYIGEVTAHTLKEAVEIFFHTVMEPNGYDRPQVQGNTLSCYYGDQIALITSRYYK